MATSSIFTVDVYFLLRIIMILPFQHCSACWRRSTARSECQEPLMLRFWLLSPGLRAWSGAGTGTRGCKRCFSPLSCSSSSAFLLASSSKLAVSLRCFARGCRQIVCLTVWILSWHCFICDLLRRLCCLKLSSWFCTWNLNDEDGLS